MKSQPIETVLIIGLKSIPYWHTDLANGFTEEKIQAYTFVTAPQTLDEKIDRALFKTRWFQSKPRLDRLLEDCRRIRPDLILFLGMFVLPSRVVETLETGLDYRPLLTGWVCDCFEKPKFKHWHPSDYVFYFDSFLKDVLPQYYTDSSRYSYLPLAANPLRYHPVGHEKKQPLLFAGTLKGGRKELIAEISKKIPVDVFGPHSNRQSLRKRKKLSSDEINALYSQHYITLNINQAPNTRNGANFRVFEASASGTLLLTQNCADLDMLYDDRNEMLRYSSPEALINLYLTHITDLSQSKIIAANGLQRTLSEHTFRHRARSILSALS